MIYFWIIYSFVHKIYATTQSPYLIAHDFVTPVSSTYGWTISPAVSSPYSSCGAYGTILGGYDKFSYHTLTKTFTLSAPSFHWGVNYRCTFYKIDSWDYNSDYLKVYLNGALYASYTFSATTGTERCGGADYPEYSFSMSLQHSTTASTLTVQIVGVFNSAPTVESWGAANSYLYALLCDTTCLTCDGNTYTDCLTCRTGYYLNPDGQCLTTCPATSYFKDTAAKLCRACHSYCLVCYGTSNTACTSCQIGRYLQYLSNICLTNCPAGYYPNASDQKCYPCDSTCATCNGGTTTDCLTCKTMTYLQPQVASCLSTCPETNYYPNDSTLRCTLCNTACLICTGPSSSECSGCNNGYYLQPITNPISCFTTCPNGNYRKAVANVCDYCDVSCAICTGPNNDECSSCNDLYFLQPSKIQCLSTCPASLYFPNSKTRTCDRCHNYCLVCSGGLNTECTACAYINAPGCNNCSINFFLQPSPQTICLNTCPKGTYKNTLIFICDACSIECADCYGAPATACTECNPGYYLQPSPSNNVCNAICPDTWYGNDLIKKCSNCVSPCKFCEDPKACINCITNYYLYEPDKTCILNCPDGYYKNNVTYTCSKCYMTCLTCFDFGPNFCYKCPENLFIDGNTCKDTCPDGKYKNLSPKACRVCISPCVKCEGPLESQCITCANNYYLNPPPNDKLCSLTCPPKYYGKKNKCTPCSNNCLECITPTGGCKSCLPTFFLHAKSFSCGYGCPDGSFGNINTFECLDGCESDEYANNLRICNKCSDNCLECELYGTGSECTKCVEDKIFFQKNCLSICPVGFFRDNTTKSCSRIKRKFFLKNSNGILLKIGCGGSCKLCESASKCLECLTDLFVKESDNSCIPCAEPTEIKEGLKCVDCVQNCEVCASKGICLKCKKDYFLKSDDFCIAMRPINPKISFGAFPTLVYLDFVSETQLFVDLLAPNISYYISVNISSAVNTYDFSVSGDKNSSNALMILLDLKIKIEKGTELKITIKKEDWMVNNIEEVLKVFEFTIKFEKDIDLCPFSSYRNPRDGVCEGTNLITPELSTTNDPSKVTLAFDQSYPELFSLLVEITMIQIQDVESSDFSYDFYQTSELNFEISIKALKSKKEPLMIVSFFLPYNITTNPKVQLSTTFLTLSLWNYVDKDSSEMQEASTTGPVVGIGDILTKYSATLSTIFYSNSLTLRGGMLAESIKGLRYIKVEFPGNCIKLFENKPDTKESKGVTWVPDLNLVKDPKDRSPTEKFGAYGVHPYILNNLFPYMARIAGVSLLGILFSQLPLRRDYLKRSLLLRCFTYYQFNVFIWTMPIATCLFTYPTFALFTFISLKWFSLKSGMGILNFSFTIATAVYLVFLQRFIYVRILLFKKELIKMKQEEEMKMMIRMRSSKAEIVELQHMRRSKSPKKKKPLPESKRKTISERKTISVGVVKVLVDAVNTQQIFPPDSEKRSLNEIQEKPLVETSKEEKSLVLISKGDKALDENSRGEKTLLENSKGEKLLVAGQSLLEASKGEKALDEITKGENALNEIPKGEKPSIENSKKETELKEINVQNDPIASIKNSHMPETTNSSEKIEKLEELFPTTRNTKNKSKHFPELHDHLAYFDKSGIDRLIEQYKVIHSDLKMTQSKISPFFPLVDMNRHLINSLVIVFLSQKTSIQIPIICLTNISVLLFIVIIRPFESKKVLFLSIINEILINIVTGCTEYIYILDTKKDLDLQKRFLIGRLILYSNMALLYLTSTLFVIDFLFMSWSFLKSIRYYCLEKIAVKTNNFKRRRDAFLPQSKF